MFVLGEPKEGDPKFRVSLKRFSPEPLRTFHSRPTGVSCPDSLFTEKIPGHKAYFAASLVGIVEILGYQHTHVSR